MRIAHVIPSPIFPDTPLRQNLNLHFPSHWIIVQAQIPHPFRTVHDHYSYLPCLFSIVSCGKGTVIPVWKDSSIRKVLKPFWTGLYQCGDVWTALDGLGDDFANLLLLYIVILLFFFTYSMENLHTQKQPVHRPTAFCIFQTRASIWIGPLTGLYDRHRSPISIAWVTVIFASCFIFLFFLMVI